ncbi:GNAT family N-acetyltransferase [Cytobacillus sp. Sa5YUA1]|uniref:GNAT family N-acetyltransferase n=1 Tax=Cytobacillus stercorigallinarum TaxID=2762240 RepID=A0ABR8QP03_9BACI|nr:GNAT family N-acetyltransferase [Cytobacillus stercorigallinarum]MBD7937255.1 GNAT family N-acetyltransferase [Cytobacillus stercorigallinarum]
MEMRKATMNDIEGITELMGHLGYPTTFNKMKIRLNNIYSSPDYHTLIASDNGKIVGMIGLVKGYYYELDGLYIRIVVLVVDKNYRNKGIGKQLLENAESWANNIGATGIGLNSGDRPERINAHHFYKKNGYVEKSIGFAKKMS